MSDDLEFTPIEGGLECKSDEDTLRILRTEDPHTFLMEITIKGSEVYRVTYESPQEFMRRTYGERLQVSADNMAETIVRERERLPHRMPMFEAREKLWREKAGRIRG